MALAALGLARAAAASSNTSPASCCVCVCVCVCWDCVRAPRESVAAVFFCVRQHGRRCRRRRQPLCRAALRHTRVRRQSKKHSLSVTMPSLLVQSSHTKRSVPSIHCRSAARDSSRSFGWQNGQRPCWHLCDGCDVCHAHTLCAIVCVFGADVGRTHRFARTHRDVFASRRTHSRSQPGVVDAGEAESQSSAGLALDRLHHVALFSSEERARLKWHRPCLLFASLLLPHATNDDRPELLLHGPHY